MNVRPARLVLLGHPVSHSLSPLFQNAALRSVGVPLRYEALDIPAAILYAHSSMPVMRLHRSGRHIQLLDMLDPEVLEWTIAGWHAEKISLLLHGLPKAVRKGLVPVPEGVLGVTPLRDVRLPRGSRA